MPYLPFPADARLLSGARVALVAAAALLGVAADSRAADHGAFRTAAGAEVRMVPVSRLDCPALDAKLAEIDRTGFRGNGPVPLHAEDEPLYRYERAVANALYTRCAGDMSGAAAARVLRRSYVRE